MNLDPTSTNRLLARSGGQPGRWRRKLLPILLVLILLAAGLAWVLLRHEPAAQTGPRGRFGAGGPIPVVAAKVVRGDIPIALNELGTVTPLAMVTVRTQIAGQLVEVGFQEGQEVKTGDFLAQIDPRPYQRQLDQYQGQLGRDSALLKDAKINLERYRTLVQQDSIARQQLDTQDSLVKQYEGAVETDKALVDTARLNLTYCHIVAPVTGRVGLRQVDPGNYVQTSDANGIVVITQMRPISVIFTLPEDNLPAVLKRLAGGASLPATALDRNQSTPLATGLLTTVDNQIDTSTGTVKLRAKFDNADGLLFPNQFVNVRLLVDTLHDVVALPPAAIQRGAPGTFVYLVKPDNTVTVQPVKLGPGTGDLVAVTAGLEPDALVVVDGADKLKDGAQISLPSGGGDAAPAAGGAGDGEHRHQKKPQQQP